MIARSLLLAGLICCSLLGFAQDGAGINWFEPLAAKTGDQVIISCRNFPGGDSTAVFFNGITAKILKNTPDHLVIIVPPGKSAGLITVSGPGITLTSKERFKLLGDPGTLTVTPRPPAAATLTSKSLPASSNEKTAALPAATAKLAPDKAALKSSSAPVVKPPLAVAVKATTPTPLKTTAPVPAKTLPSTSSTVTPALPAPTTATKGTQITTNTLAKTVVPRSATEAPAAAPEEKSAPEKVKSVGKPLILSFFPKTGPPGTLVHISGLNFGFDKQEVTVSIRSTSLTVQSVYDQEIVVLIPADMTQSGSLVVVVSGRKISSRDQFRNN